MKRLQPYIPALGTFCLALLVRIVYNLTVARGYVPEFDAGFYQTIALHLLKEHCFCLIPYMPTTGRAPLWPIMIAIIYAIAGPVNFYARLFLSFVGSGTCVLTYLFARDIFNSRTGMVAGILAALYPGLFIYDGWLYSESLFTFLLLAFCYTLYLLQRTSQQRWIILSGISLCLMSLTRPNGLLFLGLLIIWAIIIGRAKILPWRLVAKSVFFITLIALGLIAPWTVRNYYASHSFVLVATGSGAVLVGAYNDTVLVSTQDRGMWVPLEHVRPPIKSEANSIAYLKNWVRNHLSAMPYLLGLHFVNLWKPYTPEAGLPVIQFPDRVSSKLVWSMMLITPIPIFLLAAFGLIVTWRRRSQLLIIYLAILLTIAQCLIFYGSSRLRSPIEPMLVVLASGGIWWLTQSDYRTMQWMLGRHSKTTTTPLSEAVTEPAIASPARQSESVEAKASSSSPEQVVDKESFSAN